VSLAALGCVGCSSLLFSSLFYSPSSHPLLLRLLRLLFDTPLSPLLSSSLLSSTMSGHTDHSPPSSPLPAVVDRPRKPPKGSQANGDPLAHLMAPPVNETLLQRTEREAREREAKRRSDAIDAGLEIERRKLKNDRGVKVLLLGEPLHT
jgi:hypothetical protein